jgi:hypothetical protein
MSINGSWSLFYDWGCTGSYGQAGLAFNADGTFIMDGATEASGNWALIDGTFLLNWNSGPAIYGGNLTGAAMAGGMVVFGDLKGCWYATQTTSAVLSAESKQAFDMAGNKIEQ